MACTHFVLWQLSLSVLSVFASETEQVSPQQPIPTDVQRISNGSYYELVETKLESLDYRISQLVAALKVQNEQYLSGQRLIQDEQNQLRQIVDHHERKIANLVEGLDFSLGSNMTLIPDQLQVMSIGVPLCSEDPRITSGICRTVIGGQETVVQMERHRFGRDWLVVLQRGDGSVDFNRSWADYRSGFGTAGQEFWLGLDRLHQLTESAAHELLIEMEDFEENFRYARYSAFAVGSEADSYALNELGSYEGTAGNFLAEHKGSNFAAYDHGATKNCAIKWSGGWWYIKYTPHGERCYNSHLSGKWKNEMDWTSINWNSFGSPKVPPLKFARMSVRKV